MTHKICSTRAETAEGETCMDPACLIHGEKAVICCAECLRSMETYGDELPEERFCDDCAADMSPMEVIVDIRLVLEVGKDTPLTYNALEEDIRGALQSLREYPADDLFKAVQRIEPD